MGHRILLVLPTDVDTEIQRKLWLPAQAKPASGHAGTVWTSICLAFLLLQKQTPVRDGKLRVSRAGVGSP